MNKFSIQIACTTLEKGGVIAYPTEAVFGLGCDPMNSLAVEKLLRMKHRSKTKGLIIVAAEYEQLLPFIGNISMSMHNKIMANWPGATNWLLPANPSAPAYLRGTHSLQAARVSNHPIIRKLCRDFGGAIISTSANTSHRPPAKNTMQVRYRFNKQLDYILDAPVGKEKQPCEIIDALNDDVIR